MPRTTSQKIPPEGLGRNERSHRVTRRMTDTAVAVSNTQPPILDDGEGDMDSSIKPEEEHIVPRRSSIRKRKRVATPVAASAKTTDPVSPIIEPNASDSDLTPLEDESIVPKKKRSKRKKTNLLKNNDEGEEAKTKAKPTRKPRPPKSEPVYVIPDVEKRDTTFKGRLGYACLNTILRNKKPAAESIFCSRTCRIDSIKKNGLEWVLELGRQNVKDLLKIIQWNEENNIRFMRMSSEMFPFASHIEYGYSLEYCSAELKAIGDLANKLGHRLTTHPGQFTQLGSPKKDVVTNAVRDLTYHCEMIDRMGLGKDSVMIIHGGGTYGDKAAALVRIKKSFTELLPQNVKDRLVLENDEMCFSAEDLLPLCEELNIPLVFDYHHDWINPSSISPSEIIRRANAIFERRGIKPKQHLSEPRPGAVTVMEKRAHADRCERLPPDLPDNMDLMIEAKDKEQAVFHLYRIYDLQPVIQGNLRPPAENQSLFTKGRKSSKKKAAETGIIEDNIDDISDEDPGMPVYADGSILARNLPDNEVLECAPTSRRTKTRSRSERTVTTDKTEQSTGECDGDMTADVKEKQADMGGISMAKNTTRRFNRRAKP